MAGCLVIIDVQKGFLSKETDYIPNKIQQLLDFKKFDHIVGTKFINIEGSPYIKLKGWRGLIDEESRKVDPIVLANCEKIFTKTIYSCFDDKFEKYLIENNIDKLYFLGIDTDCCVLKSASDCFEKNISFEILINYCASNGGIQSHAAAITVMERIIGRQAINSKI